MIPPRQRGGLAHPLHRTCNDESAGHDASCAPVEETSASTSTATPETSTATAATITVPSGTPLTLPLNQRISTRDNSVGDGFTATVSSALTEGDLVLIPQGAAVRGTVTAVQKPDGRRPALIKVELDQIQLGGEHVPIQAAVIETNPQTESEMTDEGKKIGAGAAVGALIGAVAGDGAKEALMGAAAGAAAGTAIALGTRDSHGGSPEGSPITIELESPLDVPAPRSP